MTTLPLTRRSSGETEEAATVYIVGPDTLTTIDSAHQMVHEGWMFEADYFDASVADAAAITMMVRANGTSPHIRFQASAGGDAHIQVIEAPTISDVGALISPVNRNRTSTRTALTVVSSGAAYTGGLTILQGFMPGGTAGRAVGSSMGTFAEELILKPATDYIVTLTNISGQARAMCINLAFYEKFGGA